MPLLFAGIAWLAEFIAAALGALFVWLLQFFTKRTANTVYAIAAMVALTGVFFAALSSALGMLQAVAPPGLNQALGLVVPDNLTQCASAIIAAHVARWIYVWHVKIAVMKQA